MTVKCEQCGKSGARRMVDPFMEDVYNEIVYVVLCDDCEYERVLEI
jgi:hypothetical protein